MTSQPSQLSQLFSVLSQLLKFQIVIFLFWECVSQKYFRLGEGIENVIFVLNMGTIVRVSSEKSKVEIFTGGGRIGMVSVKYYI